MEEIKLNDGNIFEEENYKPDKKSKKQKIIFTKESYESFGRIIPQVGITEKEMYVKNGKGFLTSIRFTSYNDYLDSFWMSSFAKIPGVIIVMDVEPENKRTVQTGVDRTVNKQEGNMNMAKNYSQKKDAYEIMRENKRLYDEVKDGSEGVNTFTTRLILFGKTLADLERKKNEVEKIMATKTIEGTIAQHEIGIDINLTKFSNPIKQLSTTSALASSFPFYDQDIVDPEGLFIGYTQTGGLMHLDMARKWEKQSRLSYDAVVLGKKGSGKSVLLKNIMLQEHMRGHQQIILDPENEYGTLVRNFGGQVISMKGKNSSIINPLEIRTVGEINEDVIYLELGSSLKDIYEEEIYKDVVMKYGSFAIERVDDSLVDYEKLGEYKINIHVLDENENSKVLPFDVIVVKEVDEEKMNLSTHVANVSTFIQFFNEDLDNTDLLRIEEGLRDLYEAWDINLETNTMNYLPNEFPLLDDLHYYFELEHESLKKAERLEEHVIISIERIKLTLRNIVETYGQYFNHHSTINVTNESLICFNLKPLSNSSTANILKAMMFNILNVFVNKQMNINKQFNDNRNSNDRRRLLRVIIDESHLILNEDNLSVVKYIEVAVKLFRKYSGGTLLASQDIEDFLKESKSEVSEKLKKIFQATTYKFLMNQDSVGSSNYAKSLGSNINVYDLEKMQYFETGQFLLLLPTAKIFGSHIVDKPLLKLFETENVTQSI